MSIVTKITTYDKNGNAIVEFHEDTALKQEMRFFPKKYRKIRSRCARTLRRFDNTQVRQIREMGEDGMSARQIADFVRDHWEIDLSEFTYYAILNRRTYREVE